MTAFLTTGIYWAPAASPGVREALPGHDGWLSRPYSRPIRRWQSGHKAQEFPPG
jgi:hypothetical protein